MVHVPRPAIRLHPDNVTAPVLPAQKMLMPLAKIPVEAVVMVRVVDAPAVPAKAVTGPKLEKMSMPTLIPPVVVVNVVVVLALATPDKE